LAIGNKEEHAILLCNFFLYFGKKALVLLGTSVLEVSVVIVCAKLNQISAAGLKDFSSKFLSFQS
jgi:hypothetical protein